MAVTLRGPLVFEFALTVIGNGTAMEPGTRRPCPEPPDPLYPAAATVRTLEDLAALLRDLRRRHARSRRDSTLTYRELAVRTGWSQTAIAEYFTARTLPPTDRLDALLEVLCATPAERRALATARDRVEETNRRAKRRPITRSVSVAPASASAPTSASVSAATAVDAPSAALAAQPCAVPRQLPAAPRLFTGRTRELTRLDTALDEQAEAGGTLVISVIGGMGGVGKTWLALHWAHRHLDRFPDGQLYVDLRGFDPTGRPLAPATVVRGFLEALDVAPTAIPTGQEAQAALYRSLAADRRMLIVLDNAQDTAQVVPLLPGGATCTVLITSRRQLSGLIATHGAHALALDVLPGDEARQLLARHLGRTRLNAEPVAAATLLGCCAGLPLALSVAAARVTAHPHLSLTSLATELHDDAHRLDALNAGEPQADLRAVLSWSSHALSPDAARAFALLGIAPGPDIEPSAAASLLARSPAATRAALRELDHAHLIQRHCAERYRMHDLLRLHAAEQARDHLTPAEQQAALRRLVDFYAHTSCAGARLLAPHHPAPPIGEPVPGCVAHPLPDQASTMAWFDAEHDNLLAAQQLARRRLWDAEVCHLAWALDPYHRRRGHLDDQATAWRLAVSCARRLRDPAVRIQAHQMLGDARSQLGRTADALHHLRHALALAERTGDIVRQAEIHHSLGGMWERHGDDRRALEHAHRALLIFRGLDDTFFYSRARALNAVGWLQTRLGAYCEARANCEAALELLRQYPSGNRQVGESSTLDSLGYIAYRLGEYDKALDYYGQALAICRAQGHSFLQADVLHRTGEIRLAQHRHDGAREAWEQALELYAAQHRFADAEHVRQQLDALDNRTLTLHVASSSVNWPAVSDA
ncbi:MAG TPA: tetratricopeptide repeat protein [Actinocrinis sp.]|nr:tetratricopeptide repeat protein [Actinocrinis sp.]